MKFELRNADFIMIKTKTVWYQKKPVHCNRTISSLLPGFLDIVTAFCYRDCFYPLLVLTRPLGTIANVLTT